MNRRIEWRFNDVTNALEAVTQRQDGTGSDVVWSTTDTALPSPWVEPPFPPAE